VFVALAFGGVLVGFRLGLAGVGVRLVALRERHRVDVVGDGEDLAAVLLHGLDDARHGLLEARPVHDHEVGLRHVVGGAGGQRRLVRVGAPGHEDLDVGRVADQVLDHVAQDGRRDHDRRAVAAARRRPVVAAGRQAQRQGEPAGDRPGSENRSQKHRR
jgi:hypothetical protein